jgi:hypothetical protein
MSLQVKSTAARTSETSHSHLRFGAGDSLTIECLLPVTVYVDKNPEESQRDSVTKPRVGLRHEGLPWV